MGYYTDYEITKAPEGLTADLLDMHTNYMWDNDLTLRNAKWYDWSKDMCLISLMFPGQEIVLKGTGEEFPDLWKQVFKDGAVIRKYRGAINYIEEEISK